MSILLRIRAAFLSQTKLRRRVQHAANSFFGQIFQRRLTTSGSRQRDIRAKRFRQSRRIDADLRHVAVRFCAREKFAVASLDKDVKDGRFERWIRGMTVRFPTAIQQIDFDAAANWFAAVDANRSVAKIRAGFAVPGAELDDVDFIAGRC